MTSPELRPDIPHAARIWNYWMGGTDNFPADRAAGDAVVGVYPEIALMARFSRQFLTRVVRFLATDAGIRQFLDVGTGLPTMQNTHEIAPGARVVYVDHDPLVLEHARSLQTSAEYVLADYHEPERILAAALEKLDFTEPVAVMFMGVLGYEPSLAEVRRIVGTIFDATPPGSYLVLWDGTNTTPSVVEGAKKLAESGGAPYILRSPADLATCFEGLELVEPGLTQITAWRPGGGDVEYIDAYGAVARKP
ncbi:SAM-dependent methyltransferase [Actinoplanes sp. NPDC026619]|uniref:SAM-dependent methyltransferase n=1 Tax=Actinoplanes sp. NPDC026619 TaxID=3155798 RepID=UPI003405C09D